MRNQNLKDSGWVLDSRQFYFDIFMQKQMQKQMIFSEEEMLKRKPEKILE